MKGRKPVPPSLLKIRGARLRGPHQRSIQIQPGAVAPPAWLCDVGRAEWDRVAPLLEASKVMSPRYQQALAAYCDSFADMVKAERELHRDGATIQDDKGRVSNHPAWPRKRDARASLLRFAQEFGLTASAAVRVAAGEEPPTLSDDDCILFG